jgi:hypothetical protein
MLCAPQRRLEPHTLSGIQPAAAAFLPPCPPPLPALPPVTRRFAIRLPRPWGIGAAAGATRTNTIMPVTIEAMGKSLTIRGMTIVTAVSIFVIAAQAMLGIGVPVGGIDWWLRLASIVGALGCGWHIALCSRAARREALQNESDAS